MVKQAVACGDGLHSYAPAQLNLEANTYQWKIQSSTGYGQAGFEGNFTIGMSNSSAAVGGKLYADNCATCHGNNPRMGRDGIENAQSAEAIRQSINNNRGGMGFLNFLSDAELANIAAYIKGLF